MGVRKIANGNRSNFMVEAESTRFVLCKLVQQAVLLEFFEEYNMLLFFFRFRNPAIHNIIFPLQHNFIE